ncbi:MAG: UDP-2,4-diacetamido-2,4,6-trideoxy-beta-L-altropyranose hydrolase [Campylobacterales bacterium]|nr:UDP-2,4-diacetamido-2,4,6-trideoxy-beta-L-altropyranose hydrolase [Campylobacterales bacterium]
MNLLFRADSSSQIGLGHIMRDLVLAQRYPDANITFACQDLSGHIMDKIPYPVHILKSNDPKELIELIKTQKIEMVIFDHYGIDVAFEKQIKESSGVIIMSLDDTYEKHHCDILLNHNISADKNRYSGLVPTYCELQCGSDYTLIRDEFKHEKTIPREKIYDIFIAMGGADATNITPKILNTLSDILQLCVVTTSANAHLEELKTYIKEKTNIALHINANNIAKLLHQSRFAIITPSVMVHEVLFMEVPFIAIKTAENQNDIFQYLKQHHYDVREEWDVDTITQLYKT